MLDDAVAAFLDSVSERELDEPLLALLRSRGFQEVHLTHGQTEFGKDIVAQKDGCQWAFQSKVGNIGQPQWRGLVGQLEELRLSRYVGPEFDPNLPYRPVLVTTGRLVGNAPLLANEYNDRAAARDEPVLKIWTRDQLLSLFAGDPDAALRGSIDGQLLTLLGGIDRRDVSMDAVEQFSRRWEAFPADTISGLGVIEAAIVCERLNAATRVDLTCHLALNLIRAAWGGTRSEAEAKLAADAGGRLFETYALQLWAECDERLLRKRGLVGYSGPSAWATYPVRCMRIAELLGLLGLRVRNSNAALAEEIAEWLSRFFRAQPGSFYAISDRFAVSLIPPTLLLAHYKPPTARRALTKATVWLCDRYERGNFGLSPSHADPIDEIGRVFGDAFEHIPLRRRRLSFLAAVLLDLAAVFRYRKLYEDIRNDELAVRLSPVVLRCPDTTDQYLLTGEQNRWDVNPAYPDHIHRGSDQEAPPHHREHPPARHLTRIGRAWDLLAVSSALRDRHFVGAIRQLGP